MAAITFETVRQRGLLLEGVVDGSAYGAPALKVGGRLLACVPTNKSAEPGSIAVRIDLEQRDRWLNAYPQTFYLTEHYAPHRIVLVRFANLTLKQLDGLLRDAMRFVSSPAAKARAITKRATPPVLKAVTKKGAGKP